MSLSGDFVDAETALRVGLVTEVVEHDRLLGAALDLAATIAGNDRVGVRTLLASYRRAEEHVVAPALQVENETSRQWMENFTPERVAERRDDVIGRGRAQNAP